MGSISITQLAVLAPLAVYLITLTRRFVRDRMERKGYPLPPGPTPLPLLGSALSVDMQEPFKTYTEWRAKYGDIIYLRLLDMDVVVLNSPLVTTELLEKRSQMYSNRPYIATIKPFGHESDFAFAQYGEYWKLCRRIIHQSFSADASVTFHPMQLHKARQLMLNLVDSPSEYYSHYSLFTAAVTMCSIYDYDPRPRDDQMVSIIDDFLEVSMPALVPEKAVLLKVFPFVLYMPDWFPGTSLKREAKAARELAVKIVNAPYQYVQKRMESKEDVNPSMVSDHITRMEKLDDAHRTQYEKALKETSSTASLGSVGATKSMLMTFTLAMVQNPHVWKRAQADIDAVVGLERLPDFNDRSSLPYIDAILRETLRWQPPAPLGAPHATTKNDIYNGYFIPKGATVFGNIWGMSRDEVRYPNAEMFNPERFLDAEGMLTDDIPDFAFGFGRRICPGRYTVNSSMWIAIATMLAAFDFNVAKNADGKDIEFEVKWLNGLARHPLTFPCNITPRVHVDKSFLERTVTK